MRTNYSISSQELSDKLLLSYEHLVYLLGYQNRSIDNSGLYDRIQASGINLYTKESGILSSYSNQMTDELRFDYIYRKHYNSINYRIENGS